MRLTQLRKLGAYWQKELNLPEWKIAVFWDDPELNAEQVDGTSRWAAEYLHAAIYISKRSYGQHHTLIHEMLHIVLDGDKNLKEGKYSETHERKINRLADALLQLYERAHKRRNRPRIP